MRGLPRPPGVRGEGVGGGGVGGRVGPLKSKARHPGHARTRRAPQPAPRARPQGTGPANGGERAGTGGRRGAQPRRARPGGLACGAAVLSGEVTVRVANFARPRERRGRQIHPRNT